VHTQNLHLVIKKVFTNNKLICRWYFRPVFQQAGQKQRNIRRKITFNVIFRLNKSC
jgi:hypothetical protein